MKIGVTGGIGSGKSYVVSKLSERGIRVYDCDNAAKRLMRSSRPIIDALTTLIGSDTYIDGQLNKAKVAEFLLASDTNKQAINDIVHPVVAADFETSGIDWMECAILYESGFDRLVDMTVAVTASEATRITRIIERDGISETKAREWISQQWPQEKVVERSDFVIHNDGNDDVDGQLNELMKKLGKVD